MRDALLKYLSDVNSVVASFFPCCRLEPMRPISSHFLNDSVVAYCQYWRHLPSPPPPPSCTGIVIDARPMEETKRSMRSGGLKEKEKRDSHVRNGKNRFCYSFLWEFI